MNIGGHNTQEVPRAQSICQYNFFNGIVQAIMQIKVHQLIYVQNIVQI